MFTRFRRALLAGAAMFLVFGCSGPSVETARVRTDHRDAALPAITALQQGSFERAAALAGGDETNPYTRLVRAIVRYEKAMRQLAVDGRTVLIGGFEAGGINQKYLSATFGDALSELAAVEADLEFVARHRGMSIELCLACWDIDWNGNGRIDDRDQRLLEIEEDAHGNPIPEGDPRRKPTFRFDDGDIPWARAFVSFERAALEVLLAYDFSDATAFARRRRDRPAQIVLRLTAPERIARAKQLILEGLDHSDAARRAYLEETDDDREWVPSPRQKSHPMPLPVDEKLYETWAGVVGDVRRMVRGEEGLYVADLIELASDRPPPEPPPLPGSSPSPASPRAQRSARGYLDIGSMLAHPKDIVINIDELKRLEGDDYSVIEAGIASVFGKHYVREMKPSPLPRRLLRMRSEIYRGDEALGKKLRYLFWLN